MNYIRIYHEIILKAKFENRNKNEGIYYENHHIQPKSIGGDNSKSNLVLLTAREHFICHKLLYKSFPNNRSLFYAYYCMLSFNNGKRKEITSRLFEIGRILFSEYNKTRKIIVTDEQKEKISKSLLKYYENHDGPTIGLSLSFEHKKKISESLLKHYDGNIEQRQKLSNSLKNFYNNISDEDWNRIFGSRIITDEHKKKISDSLLKYYEENDSVNLGKIASEEVKNKISNSLIKYYEENEHSELGKPLTEEHKNNISNGLNKFYETWDDESRILWSESRKGVKNPFFGKTHSEELKENHREIFGKHIIFDGARYPSIKRCSELTGHARKYIRKLLKKGVENKDPKFCYEN